MLIRIITFGVVLDQFKMVLYSEENKMKNKKNTTLSELTVPKSI
jgi:hypothetical protein